MEGIRKLLVVFSLIIVTLRFAKSLGSIKPNEALRDGETLVSPGGMFELGFFSTGNTGNRYLGIWFKKDSTTVVWVANRETPLVDKGVLNFTDKGMLVLADAADKIIWSSNISAKNPNSNPVATLLDSGNFVVTGENADNDPEKFLWQSFDFPCDTLLPGMKIGRDFVKGVDKFLSSWKSAQNPSPGQFSLAIDVRGVPQLVIKKGKSTIIFRAGSWNGVRFTGAPGLRSDVEKYYFVASNREIYHSFELRNKSSISRYQLNPLGLLQRFMWNDMTNDWSISASTQADQCENYALCGAYGSCNLNKNPICQCLEGFVSKSLKNPSSSVDRPDGCVRKTALACNDRDGFFKHAGIKLPDTAHSSVNPSMNINECRQMCLRNCSCSAFATSDIRGGGSGCLLWFGNLMDMKDFNWGGQDLYIRLAATELAKIYHENRISNKQKVGVIAGTTVLAMGMLILGLVLCIWKRRLRKKEKIDYLDGENEEMELPLFDLKVIVTATNNFSDDNKLGRGGFGPVYKGTLPEGKDIAVKRLSKNSGQGLKEFKNEVVLIAKLQHRNLVKLLGCCIEGDEKMLIYEYMPNKSLDSFIFDQNQSKLLNWDMRMRIIGGIARGMLYLHQDSRHRIIHRDLKASNVLLDKDMNPKISDFGMARMFGGDETGDRTRKVVGTYGYMSPEYAVDGRFSIKSDVFSFGVLVLEIVNGRKNRGFSHLDHDHNLLGHAWILWMENRPLDFMDDVLADSCVYSEVLRCIHVGLLCVQKRVEDRPNMSSVVLMLNGESSLPQPKQPGFFTERSMPDSDTSSSKHGSTNDVTITSLEPR